MSNKVKINLNLSTGEVEINAPVDALEEIFDRLESFVPKLATEKTTKTLLVQDGQMNEGDMSPAPSAQVDSNPNSQPESKTQDAKPKGSSPKTESYTNVDLNLTKEQRSEFKEFYKIKAAANQSDHVLVIIYWLSKNTSVAKFTMNDIYTGLRIVGEKIPKRISSVLSNLNLDSRINKENSESTLTHVGEDYVEHDLPKKIEK